MIPGSDGFFNTGHIFMSKIATNITQWLCDIYCFQVLQHQNTDRYIKKTYHEYRPASLADNYKYYSISGWYWVRWIPILSYLYMVLLLYQNHAIPTHVVDHWLKPGILWHAKNIAARNACLLKSAVLGLERVQVWVSFSPPYISPVKEI